MLRPARCLLALVSASLIVSQAWADPPNLGGLTPIGVARGTPTILTVQGGNLADSPRLILPFGATVEPQEGSDAGNWKVQLSVPPDTAPGFYPIRVQTDGGISNPILLAVDSLPALAEAEPNNTFEQAQAVTLPVAVEGQCGGNDVDFVRFAGRKGQRLVIDAQCARVGSGVDPQIRLTTVDRAFVASADDSPGLATDARITVELPQDGDYVVELSDTKYQGGNRPVYRLVMAELLYPAEVYPLGGRRGEVVGLELRGGTLGGTEVALGAVRVAAELPIEDATVRVIAPDGREAFLPTPLDVSDSPEIREPAGEAPPPRVTAPVVLNGRIEAPGDEDRFTLVGAPNQKYRVAVHAADLGSALDGVLRVLHAGNGSQLATGDDTQVPPIRQRGQNRRAPNLISPDPSLEFAMPGDQSEVVLAIRDLADRGGVGFAYRIVVEPATPTFLVELADAQVSIPKGGSVTLPVSLSKQEFDGPITLTVSNPPAGLAVRPTRIAPGQPVGVISLQATAEAAFEAIRLDVIGQAETPGGPITEHATRQIAYAQQANIPVNIGTQFGLYAAPAPAAPVSFEVAAEPIEATQGYPTSVPVKIVRAEGADAGLSITPLPLPPGVAVPEAKAADKATEGTFTVNVAPEAALGEFSIGLQAKGKFGDKEHVLSLPAVTLRVVRPVELALAAPTIELKPGETKELTGKVIRHGGFKEPVKVTLANLPAGVTAEPVEVPTDAAEFTLKVVAAGDAQPVESGPQVTLDPLKIADKEYKVPPTGLTLKVVKP